MKRKILRPIMIILFACVLSLTAVQSAQASWADPYLERLMEQGVLRGDPDGNLNPGRDITRAEFIAMINRAFGFTQKGVATFADVERNAWYFDDISIGVEQGYIQGSDELMRPNDPLTREEAVAMLCRALKIPMLEEEVHVFADALDFSNWGRDYINAAVDRGVISGYPDNTFKATNNITRGEAAKMLSEIAGEIVDEDTFEVPSNVDGNVTIRSSNVTLTDVTIEGDLFVTEGVGLGFINLRNVKVLGEVIISGAGESHVGESSITMLDSSISELTVDISKDLILTLKADRGTRVEKVVLRSSAYLEELLGTIDGFEHVVVEGWEAATFANLYGDFKRIDLMSVGAAANLYKGTADGIWVDEVATNAKIFLEKNTHADSIYFDASTAVTGTGTVDSVLINAAGVTITQMPDYIYIRPGITATVNGEQMGSLDAETDSLDPAFVGNYPYADDIEPTSFGLYVMTNKPGEVYYATYLDGVGSPSADDLTSETSKPKDSLKNGSFGILPETETIENITGLTSNVEYETFVVFVDFRGEVSDVRKVTVTTEDNVVPALASGYPKVVATDKTTATIALMPTKDTRFYWAVLPDIATAPVKSQVLAQSVPGAVAMGTGTAELNEEMTFTVTRLEEFTEYVLYLALKDAAGNESSSLIKLSFVTKDVTPPKFDPPDLYPRLGTLTASTIPIEYMVDEPGTVYWAAVKTGNSFLPEVGGAPDLYGANSKDLLKSGAGAELFGKGTAAKEDTLYKISISGVEKERLYDVYMMVEDAAGNLSDIVMIVGKTLDRTKPTAELGSDQIINDQYSVESPIRVTFSEIVATGETSSDGELILFVNTDKNDLGDYVRLIDMNTAPEQEIAIDWDLVTVEHVDGATQLVFPPTSFIDKLENNNNYRFELAYSSTHIIQDTSRNQMDTRTILEFSTVPPLTYFTEVRDFDADLYDVAFYFNPESQQTGANIYFDIMILSDQLIEFELYRSFTSADTFTEVTVGKEYTIQPDHATSLSELIGAFTRYNELNATYYAIKLTRVGNTDISGTSPLTADVNLEMYAVIGNTTRLDDLALPRESFGPKLTAYVAGGDVWSVTAPTEPFELRISLVDQVPPAEIPPTKFTGGDRQAVMEIKTDKEALLYYWALPKYLYPDTSDLPSHTEIQTAVTDPTRGISSGFFNIPDTPVAVEHTIEGLIPPSSFPTGITYPSGVTAGDYVVFYYLKGNAANPSQVYVGEFSTIPVEQPLLVSGTALSYVAGSKSVRVSSTWDSDCTVYYVLYPAGVYGPTSRPTVAAILEPEFPSQLISSGSYDTLKGVMNAVSVAGLDYTVRYDIFVYGQKFVGTEPSGDPSPIYELRNMAPIDDEAPRVQDGSPNTVIADSYNSKYWGTVQVNFTEGLYYFEQNQVTNPIPFTPALLTGADPLWSTTAQGDIMVADSATSDGALTMIMFNFDGVPVGTTISFDKTIGDAALNIAGTFRMTLTEEIDLTDPDNPVTRAVWVATFS